MMEPELAGESPASPPTEPQPARRSKGKSLAYLGHVCGAKGTGDWALLVIIIKIALIINGRDAINLKAGPVLRGNEGEAPGSPSERSTSCLRIYKCSQASDNIWGLSVPSLRNK